MKRFLHFTYNKLKALFVFAFLLISIATFGQTINSGVTSNASAFPVGSNIVINAGGTLNMDVSRSFATITTANSGTSTISGSGTLTVSGANGVGIVPGNTLSLNTICNTTVLRTTTDGTTSTISGTGTLNASGNVVINKSNGNNTGTITIASGITVNAVQVQRGSGNNGSWNIIINGTLGISGTAFNFGVITSVTCNAGSTVNYNRSGAQSVYATTYNNLTLSGSGTKTVPTSTAVSNNLSIASGVFASLATLSNTTVGTLTLGGLGTNAGTWGSTSSSATYKNNTYFAETGLVTVASYTSTTPTVTVTGVGSYTYTGLQQGPNTASNSGSGSSYTFSYVGTTPTVYGPSATRPTNAGNYTVTATVTDSSDGFYRSANSNPATPFIIARIPLTITALPATKCFGTTYSSTTNFTTSGLIAGESVTNVVLTSDGSGVLAAPGTYSIVPSSPSGPLPFLASNYNITPSNGTLTVSPVNTWTGVTNTDWTTISNWSCGVLPASVSDVIISSSTFYPEISSDVTINSLTLNSNTTLKVNPAYDLTVTDVIAIASNATLTIENTANLIQVNDVANTGLGKTVVKRNSSAIMRNDYTLWSSPVTGQGVYAFSSTTLPNRFYDYNPLTEAYTIASFSLTGLQYPSPLVSGSGIGINGTDTSNLQFAPGKSYLIRAPWDHPTAPTVWTGTFSGTANNGNITYSMTEGHFNAVGNPYPSRISFLDFVDGNPDIYGTLYFWRKTNNAATTSYATLNELGYVENPAAGGDTGDGFFNPGDEANWVINAGQGFFVYANNTADPDNTTDLVFNNSMRRSSNTNQFFRSGQTTTSVNDGVFWLNLSSQTSPIGQMAVGYLSDATLGVDRRFDGKSMNQDLFLASLIGTDNYAIQGRPSFAATDVVPLSYKITTAGNHSISLDHASGVFTSGQAIYLRDNSTSTIHDLTAGAYNFTSDAGTFASRFEIVYQQQLGVDNNSFNTNHVVVYKNDANSFVVTTGDIVMENIKVFDVRGSLLFDYKEVNNTQTTITAGQANQVLLIQITSKEGIVVTKKVIR